MRPSPVDIACTRTRCLWAVLCALLGATHGATAEPPGFRLPPGFAIERVAAPPEIAFPMFVAMDDRGRLFVAESSGLDLYAELQKLTRKCRVSVLEDRDGDGQYERAGVFVDKLVFPMGLVWRDGRLYVCDPPDVVVFDDCDGKAGPRRAILGGFGHIDNGSLHGLDFGPDGLLYGTLGSPDGYRLTRADGRVLSGNTGILFRCRADGSHPEVLARGFTNLVEIAFLSSGEIIGTNTWYQLPANGLRDSLVHLVEGGLYPYGEDQDPNHTPSTGRRLPALTMFSASSCSGMCRLRATQFPAAYRGNLFVAQFNTRNVTRHVLARDGSTFRSENHDFLTTDDPDFHPSDVLEDADGSLLVVDTGSWYVQHCPTGSIRASLAKGGIYRIRYRPASPVEDPWGLKTDWAAAAPERLAALLVDPRPAVQDRAARTLAARGEAAVGALAAVLRTTSAEAREDRRVAREHAIWALASIGGDRAASLLRETLGSADADLVAVAARAIARRGDRRAGASLHKLLEHPAARVRLAAAEALVRSGDAASAPALIDAMTRDPDPVLLHMLVYALSALADRPALEAALAHPHPRVQEAALVLLSQPPHQSLAAEQVISRAAAADGELRRAAQTILKQHPEWGDLALGLIRRLIDQPQLGEPEQETLRSYVLAFQSNRAVVDLVGRTLQQPAGKLPDGRRALLLDTIASCSLSPLPASWVKGIGLGLDHPNAPVRGQAVRAAAVLQIASLDDRLARVANDRAETAGIRVEALRAIVRRRPDLTGDQFALLMGELAAEKPALARLAAAQVLAESRLDAERLRTFLRAVRGDGLISPAVALGIYERSDARAVAAELLDYLAASVSGGWILPERQVQAVVAAVPAAERTAAEARLKAAQASVQDQAALLGKYETLAQGGRADRGRTLFVGKATCSTCHRVGNEGGTVGPDLTTIGSVRSPRDLVESLVLPSATIAQRYETYTVLTDAGRTLNGVLARQSPEAVVLYDAGGAEIRIRRDEIEEMEVTKRSIMPEATVRTLSDEEFRDLLAYLRSLK